MSSLTIVTPAPDPSLAPTEVMRAAAGLALDDDSRDEELTALGLRISAEIADTCGISVGEGGEPTLRKERVSETFSGAGDEVLILSRRHNVEIVSVEEDGQTVTLDARAVDREAGLVERWVEGCRGRWCAGEIVITYDAGFDTVPPGLIGIVTDLARIRLSEASADPLVKAVTVDVEGIDSVRTDRWVGGLGGKSGASLPVDVMARLSRYMNYQMR